MKSIQYLLNEKYGYPRNNIKMILFIGQDRASDFLWLQKTLLERNPSIELEIVPIERPDGAISATYIRQLAIDGDYDTFKQQMLDTGLNDDEYIGKLYKEIKEKINYKPRKKNTTIKGGRIKKKNSKSQKKNKSIK
jgi:hypothetical protein